MKFGRHILKGKLPWLSGGLLTLLMATNSLADGPIYLDESVPQRENATLDNIFGWAEFFAHGTRTRAGDFSLDETILAPGLHLEADGGLYDRQLLAFNAGGTISVQHRSLNGDAVNSKNLSFEEFAGDFRLIPEKTFNMRLFGNRTQGWHSSPYKSSTRIRSTVLGMGANLSLARFPSTLTWTSEEYLESYLTGDQITKQDRLRLGMKQRLGPVRGSLTMRHDSFQKNIQPQDYLTDGADWRLTYRPSDKLNINGSMHWLHRYGSRQHTDFHTRAITRWQIISDLEARAEAGTRNLRPGGNEVPVTSANNGSLSMHHLLFGSLETTVGLDRQDETSRRDDHEVGALRRTSGHFRMDYRRSMSVGALTMSAGHTLLRQENSGTEKESAVTNEEFVLPELAEVRLSNADVVPGSVIVTDASGFIVYTENLDYTLNEVASYTVLSRNPFGAIAPNERIMVDYRYYISPDLKFDSSVWNFAARFNAGRTWSVWIRHQETDESLISGTPDGRLQDQTRNTKGALLRLGRFTVRNEYETHQLAETRFKTNRLQLDSRFQPGRRWRASAGARHTWSFTNTPSRTQRYLQINARAAFAGSAGSTASLESWYRWAEREDGIDAPGESLYGGRLRFTRRWRAIIFEAETTLQITDRNEIDDRRLIFSAGLRRMF